ncbi:MAG: alpha/beta fold hydrolase, partial [Thermoanaerobaculia bacterium]|nr:alpha/beta fold hydrolase [Thermoanaerobaculia bacterium]
MARPRRAPFLAISLVLFVLPALAADSEDQFFDSDGVNIRYKVWGRGEPIVLVHGFTASIEANWELPGFIDALDDEFKIVALDARGHGRSDKPHEASAYGDAMGDDVIRLLDHLGIEQAHIVGYSMGGFLTLDLVTRHPERFLTATIGGAGFNDRAPLGAMDDLIASLEEGRGIGPLIEALTPEGQPRPDAAQLQAINNL